MFSTNFIFRQQENLVDNQKCQAGFRPLCNKILIIITNMLQFRIWPRKLILLCFSCYILQKNIFLCIEIGQDKADWLINKNKVWLFTKKMDKQIYDFWMIYYKIGHSISPHPTKIINCSSGKQTAKVKLNSQLDIKYAFP